MAVRARWYSRARSKGWLAGERLRGRVLVWEPGGAMEEVERVSAWIF